MPNEKSDISPICPLGQPGKKVVSEQTLVKLMLPQLRRISGKKDAEEQTLHRDCFSASVGTKPGTAAAKYVDVIEEILHHPENDILHRKWPKGVPPEPNWLDMAVLGLARYLVGQT